MAPKREDDGTVTMTQEELAELVRSEVATAERERSRQAESDEVKQVRAIIREELTDVLGPLLAGAGPKGGTPKDQEEAPAPAKRGILQALTGTE